jgi:uncharacterized caspase-like protein
MPLVSNLLALLSLLVALTVGVAPSAARAEQRIALVLGNAAYQAGALKNTANDAGLIAQTLEAAGFDVMGARDLDNDGLRRAFRDFVDKAGGLGPDGVAVVYLAGYGLQLEGENYFVPVDARIERASDIPVQAVRLSDYTRALAALKLKASLLVLDLARSHPFAPNEPIAGGLALVDPEPGLLIAFNAAPGTTAPTAEGAYGPYAKAVAEMMRQGGLPLNDMFERARLRVSDATQGAQVPWHASNVAASFVFFERTADAPASVAANEIGPALRSRPLRELGAQEAYIAALDRDTLPDYLEFLGSYANDPLASRVRALVAARREALIWRRTRSLDTPEAYWSYLRLYSDGPHVGDCYRRLAFLHASQEVPPDFSLVDYDVPPPPPDEQAYVQQLVIFLGDPTYDFPPLPVIPATFLPPISPEFADLRAPEPALELFVLPTPVYMPVPAWVRPPDYVRPPPANNVIFANLHNRVAIDRPAKTFTVTDRAGHSQTLQAPRAFASRPQREVGGQVGARRQLPASDVGPALPPSIVQLGTTNGTRLDRARRERSSPLPLPGAIERGGTGARGSAGATRQVPTEQTQPNSPLWGNRPQHPGNGVVSRGAEWTQPLARPGEPLPKPVPAPFVPPAANRANPPALPAQGEPRRSLWNGRPQVPASGGTPAAALQPRVQPGQPVPQLRHQGAQPTLAVPQGMPPSGRQAATAGQPQRQRMQQEQGVAGRAQQQAQQAAAARAQQQAQQAAAARAQQQAQQAAAARAQQQAQQAAAARAQQQAQQAAAARAQQQAQQAAAARARQQAQQAAAARAQQQAQQAAAARAQQQAQQAAAARAQAAARASPAVGAARAQHVPPRR